MSKPKQVVCPHCHRSVVAKGMRRHIALSCKMAPPEIRKKMRGRMGLTGSRLVSAILGALAFFFGLPFTLTPFFLYQLGKSDFNFGETFIDTFILLLFIPVGILFLMFGLFIQYKGLVEGIMRGNLEISSQAPDLDHWDRHGHP